VDIEVPSLKVEKIMHKFLHEEEERSFHFRLQAASENEEVDNRDDNLKPQTPNPKLTLLWSCKEAVFKWWSYGNVDFSEMIRIEPFDLLQNGIISAKFIAEDGAIPLTLHYQLFQGICLAWVIR
jgi:hypothetical protein